MKNSLDSEPPSKFSREKEVSRKRNIDLNQIIVSIKNNKNKYNSIRTGKNFEKQVRLKLQDYTFNENYLNINKNSIEDISSTIKSLSFASTLDKNLDNIASELNYTQKRNNTNFTERKISDFYEMNSSYSFTPKIREENMREESLYQSKEQETKETTYILHNFDEESEKEE
jgi:hypothetical protein